MPGFFYNHFPADCGVPDLNKKRARYTSDPLPATISIASENSLCSSTSPCNPPTIHFPGSDIPVMDHNMIKDNIGWEKQRRGYSARRHDGKICYKNLGLIALHVLFIRGFITVMNLPEENHRWRFSFLNMNIVWLFIKLIRVFISIVYIPSSVELDFWTCSLPVVLCPTSGTLLSILLESYPYPFVLASWIAMVAALACNSAAIIPSMPKTGFKRAWSNA